MREAALYRAVLNMINPCNTQLIEWVKADVPMFAQLKNRIIVYPTFHFQSLKPVLSADMDHPGIVQILHTTRINVQSWWHDLGHLHGSQEAGIPE